MLRESTYEIVLVPDGGDPPEVLASRRFQSGGLVAARLAYRVAPGGKWLGYTGGRDELHLRPASGPEIIVEDAKRGFAFSPDGAAVAVVVTLGQRFHTHGKWTGDSAHEEDEIALIDLATGARRRLGIAFDVGDVAWTKDGLVVAHQVRRDERQHDASGFHWMWDRALSLFRANAEPVELFRGELDRFTAAARASRLLLFRPTGVYAVDIAHPEWPPRRFDDAYGTVFNAEMSPDGTVALFSAAENLKGTTFKWHLFLTDAAGPRAVGDHAEDLWFADDSSTFVWSTHDKVFYGEGTRWRELRFVAPSTPPKTIDSVRFRRDADGLIAVRDNRVFAWDPGRATEQLLWTEATTGYRLIGAEHFQGGLVVWREHPDPPGTPRRVRVERR